MPNEKRIADGRRSLVPTPYSRPATMDIRSIVSNQEDVGDSHPRSSNDTRHQPAPESSGSGRGFLPPMLPSMRQVQQTNDIPTRPSPISMSSPPVRPPLTAHHTASPIVHPGGNTMGMHLNPRRQAHILSEQKRRENINSGFEELKGVVPTCANTTDSKALILRKAADYIRNLQSEVERLKAAQHRDHPTSAGEIQHFPARTMPSPPIPSIRTPKHDPHNPDVDMDLVDYRLMSPSPTPQLYPLVSPVPVISAQPQSSPSHQHPAVRPTGLGREHRHRV